MISLAELQDRIDRGELSPEAAITQSMQAIAAKEQAVGAFVCRADNPRAASQGRLRGIAVGIKDIIDTADFPTEMGSPIYKGWRPRADAAVVAMLKQAGATIIGKTTTTAFAAHDPTATLNPHNSGHTPGGSSSGSAAAVGAGMIPLALGTQTGGSVIRPASFCGVAAIKPSHRLLPTVGVKCYSWTLDTVGLFAAGVKDLAQGLSAMTGRAELLDDAAGERPRIGLMTQDFAGEPEPMGWEALRRAAAAAERAGASIRTLALPEIVAEAWRIPPDHPGVRGASGACLGIPDPHLYVYGYDVPKAYAIAKDGKMYYAFFAEQNSPFAGEVELRGLKAGKYHVVDYTDGRDFGSVQAVDGKPPWLKADFKQHLLLEVSGE